MAMTAINLATIEVFGLAPALVIADEICKAADVELVAAEGNAGQDTLVKFTGTAGDLRVAVQVAEEVARKLGARCVTALRLNFMESSKVPMVHAPQEFSAITDGYLHMLPDPKDPRHKMWADAGGVTQGNGNSKKKTNKDAVPKGPNMQAIGMLETQGLTAVIEGSDAMLKAANVELIGKEKIGAAHVTIMIRGDVAAVKAAIEAGKAAAEKVGKVVAAHVIARPHEGLAKLLPA